jgi:hypothetical protein
MSDSKSVTVGGTSFCNLLFLVFLVLKLTKVINWSWWWVTAPIWGPIALVVAILIVVGIVALIAAGCQPRNKRW